MERYRSKIILTTTVDSTIDPPKKSVIELVRYSSINIVDDIDGIPMYMEVVLPVTDTMNIASNKLTYTDTATKDTFFIASGDTVIEAYVGYDLIKYARATVKKASITQNAAEFKRFSFVGVLDSIVRDDLTITLRFEDPSYFFKLKRFTLSFKGGDLKDLISLMLSKNDITLKEFTTYIDPVLSSPSEYPTDYFKKERAFDAGIGSYFSKLNLHTFKPIPVFVDDIKLPPLTLTTATTIFEVFEMLKDKFGISSYFKLMTSEFEIDSAVVINNDSVASVGSYLVFHSGLKYFSENRLISPVKFMYPYNKNGYPIIDFDITTNVINKDTDLVVVGESSSKGKVLRIATIDGLAFKTDADLPTTELDSKAKKASDKRFKQSSEEFKTLINSRKVQITFKIPELTADELQKLVLNKWRTVPSSNMVGNLTTFGHPAIYKSDRIDLKLPNAEGIYLVDKVEKAFDLSKGLLQVIHFKNRID